MNELRNLVNVCEYKDKVDDGIQTNEIVVRVCALLWSEVYWLILLGISCLK